MKKDMIVDILIMKIKILNNICYKSLKVNAPSGRLLLKINQYR